MISQLTRRGWSMDNWSFGMGGALLQQVNRDTLRFALKCSAIDINGQWHDVYKQPVTDPGKDSRAGRFVLLQRGQRVRDDNAKFRRTSERHGSTGNGIRRWTASPGPHLRRNSRNRGGV